MRSIPLTGKVQMTADKRKVKFIPLANRLRAISRELLLVRAARDLKTLRPIGVLRNTTLLFAYWLFRDCVLEEQVRI